MKFYEILLRFVKVLSVNYFYGCKDIDMGILIYNGLFESWIMVFLEFGERVKRGFFVRGEDCKC